ncbi:DUF167 family protein [Rhodovarius sp.]|uniref:DUF167 family protein n=2 Tax=Rhodovarius sp. TaxID=2972673 RepID=UPI0034A1FD04
MDLGKACAKRRAGLHGGMENPAWSAGPNGIQLWVRLTPRAHRNGLDGLRPGADGRMVLQLRVAAPPVEGAANEALIGFLAEALAMRRGDIAIVAGETSRQKRLALRGDPVGLEARLRGWIGG